jgi:type II secretory pathway pseudopilin PulG
MSLVEIMVALGILSILALAFATFVVNQQKNMAALEQKEDSVELRNYLMLSLQNASVCTCQLNPNLTEDDSNDANLWFNSNMTDGSQTINLKKLRTGCGVSDPNIAFEGQVLPSGLTMEKIELKNIVPTGVTNEWQGDIVISWLQSSVKYSLKPISLRQKFLIDPTSPAANRIVSMCVANNGNPYGSIGIGDPVIIPQNTVQQAATDGFLTMYIGQSNAADNSAYICAGSNKADVSLCYVLPGGIGPGADTILTRATGYSGSSAMIKKGQWFQVQSIDPNGDGGIVTGIWLPLGQ